MKLSKLLLVAILIATNVVPFCAPAYSAESKRPRIALALGGGGTRGTAHIGVLRVLEKEGISVDMIAGTSMGAIVGGLYGAGISLDEIQKKFFDKSLMHSYMTVPIWVRVVVTPLFLIPSMFGKHRSFDGFYRGNKFAKYMNKSVPDNMQALENLRIPFQAVASNLLDGEPYVVSSGNFGRAIQASSAIPVLRRPVPIADELLVDGALVANVPVKQARAMGADIVIAVDVDENLAKETPETFTKMGSVSHRVIEMLLARTDDEQLKFADVVIHPKVDGIGLLSMHLKDVDRAIKEGEQSTQKALPAIREAIKRFESR